MNTLAKPLLGGLALAGLLATLLPAPRPAAAHGGEDHGGGATPAAGATGAAPDEVLMPKESQFLFDIRTQRARLDTLLTRRTLLGQVQAAPGGEGRVVAPQPGRLLSLRVQVGQPVRAGQVLAVLDQTLDATQQLGLATEQANAQAELRAAQQDYARLKSIEDIAARKDVVAAELRLRQARQNAAIQNNQASRQRITLTAPVSGTVDVFSLAAGQQVNAGDELLRIINPARLTVQAQVFAPDLAQVAAADGFVVEGLQGEATAPARLVSFSNVVNPVNQARQLVLAVDGATGLRPGQSVNVRVQSRGAKPQLAVPTAAVTDINGKPAVFVHTTPETFKLRFVQPGAADEQRTIIQGGLQEGERVVTQNTYQLKSVYLNQ
ncbi:efflux RND transporter periplasmic adaptor subunit [Hymenobacter weizhouensis]|uniref:efflux RND transporter periplasmic adaptor subunit n=1 Tax=Hymenobacter sp. YIM 151500-1 TaxID=2987689 RepID=UPI002227CDD8|nr:efflux RND transporter periplasmic adaptor subunit [Hymenobacter sp. YIM 151500-1]UYZ64881.1 efflux RND transporter periplasmic adaptor subunit [Hymenobacter sp. YIM 151500-1]